MTIQPLIRSAKEKDTDALVQLSSNSFRSAFEKNNKKSDIDLYIKENFSRQQLRDQLLDPNNVFLLLFLEPQTSPVGYAKLRVGSSEECVSAENPIEIERLYLDASAIGQGLGSMLMQACLDEASARGYQSVWLGVWEHNVRAIAFYQRWGFETVGTHPFQQGTETQTDWVMQRSIEPVPMNLVFDIETAFARLREAMQMYPRAAMFQLAEEGYSSPFEQLVSCMISIRTYDEVSLPVSRKLFERANTPMAMSKLSVAEIESLIKRSTYAERKAQQIWAIAQEIVEKHDGILPCDADTLLAFKGIGPKCAHLTLGIACHQPYISVDVHVHRVVNRWGYIETKTPEKTTKALEAKLPKALWIETNKLLMPFGKQICKGQYPQCSKCPLEDMCPQIGV